MAPRTAMLVCLFLVAAAAFEDRSQSYQPAGPKWWQQEGVQRALRLTSAQVLSLESAFQGTLPQRRALGRELESLDRELQRVILAAEADDETVARLSARTEHVRAQRHVARTLMLLKMYRVLTPEQRIQLKEVARHRLDSSER
jgi:Spy/CpxP family protein refolding chaperone